MIKYRNSNIPEEEIIIETDRYWDGQKRVEVVKLSMISTDLEVVVCSYIGQLHAYNSALKKLEVKYIKWLNEQ